ncbi:family 10 glycosylhydrolase [Limibacter armeniacum]|uniref:glycoside hydrolase family 10 protein n=1 Tax=Limibacter armeniacum TaxID=466084 RepID=UPI002FE61B28
MQKCFFWLALVSIFFINHTSSAQKSRKRELRATWIASVVNIDWPSRSGLSSYQQKQEFVRILDEHKENGMNAVIVQVRPVADAFYPSEAEPWSEYLTGEQGAIPTPYYNPLAFMIEEAHKRNLEFHAWFNPYRASMKDSLDHISPEHPIKQHPEWFVKYGPKWYYNPGEPEAREFVLDEIMRVVKHYDLDAVHFDDYFYPYKIAGEDFPDEDAYQAYCGTFTNKEDWRRYNVDYFVQQLSFRIKKEKPFVKFGISPFGVWRNQDKDPDGSATRAGQTNYDDLYADVLKWMREGWIDYVAPQLYWHIGHPAADYATLVDWWNKHSYGKHVYIGQGAYRVGKKNWEDPNQLIDQLMLNETYSNVHGSMFFSSKSLTANPLGVRDSLRNYYQDEALVPMMKWIDNKPPQSPRITAVEGSKKDGVIVKWEDSETNDSNYYVVYRFEGDKGGNTENAGEMVAKIRRSPYPQQQFTDKEAEVGKKYSYAITAVDRLHCESKSSNQIAVKHRRWFGIKVL